MERQKNKKEIQDISDTRRVEEIQPLPISDNDILPIYSSIPPSSRHFSERLGIPLPRKVKVRGMITPYLFSDHADKVLFMLSLAEHKGEVHALARGVGSADTGRYVSHLLHGTMAGDTFKFDDTPIIDLGNREDPRITRIGNKYYFTHTVVDDSGKFMVGLASTSDLRNYTDHGIIIPNLGKFDAKDPVLFPNDGNEVLMQVRMKPGIQLIRFDSMDDLLELGRDPAKRDRFWQDFMEEYQRNPKEYDYLNPNMPGIRDTESKWKPLFDEMIDKEILPKHPNFGHFRSHPQRGQFWYGPGPSPIKTEKGWLDFPHRGELIAEYSEADVRYLEGKGKRVTPIVFYCVLATLHDLKDPRKLVAVSPIPISMPDPGNEMEMNISQEEFAVPFVKIAVGALRTEREGKPHILVPIGVNDKYTRLQYLPEKEFLDWMMRYGKI